MAVENVVGDVLSNSGLNGHIGLEVMHSTGGS